MLRLLTFGGPGLQSDDGTPVPRLRPLRLALLAALAAAGNRGLSREKLAGLFWAESSDESARHSLRQALYALRQELGVDVVRSDTMLTLAPSAISSDVGDFAAALASGDRAGACALARGAFLDGFYLAAAPAFERWVEDERAHLVALTTRALHALIVESTSRGDRDATAQWWRQLTTIDPLSGRFALGYLKALADRGDRAEALAFARLHESTVRRELEADPDPGVRLLEMELRSMPSPAVERATRVPSADVLKAPSPLNDDLSPLPDADAPKPLPTRPRRRRTLLLAASVGLAAVATSSAYLGWLRLREGRAAPTLAVGLIEEEGVPDTLRIGGVLTDMLATNLARVAGLPVLANSRLFELMRPGQDTLAAGYADAARRAGASEILEGRLLAGPQWGLALEMRRVDLRTGLVKGAYRVSATDRFGLIDSLTAAITRQLHLGQPPGSVAEATTTSLIAHRLYEEGLRAYFQYDASAAQRLMAAAFEEDSTFAMAAYYKALLLPVHRQPEAMRTALRIATSAPERERLTITADILSRMQDPVAILVADTLTSKYPRDPRALVTLATARVSRGEWAGAIDALERAIAIDSAAEPLDRETCRLCEDFMQLAEAYYWWDSIPAADRTARRFLRMRPDAFQPWALLTTSAMRIGQRVNALNGFQRSVALNPGPRDPLAALRLHLMLEDYDEAARAIVPLLTTPRPEDYDEGHWLLLIVLRNQGRLREARQFNRTGRLPGIPAPLTRYNVDEINEALLALESGDAARASVLFNARRAVNTDDWFPGLRARYLAWSGTLVGMAQAAAGDTAALRRMADSVAYWGQGSGFGRDRRAHHYLRGMLHAAAGRDDEAIVELRAAIHSSTLGFTRVNYELARLLLRQGRAGEAVAVLQSALRGEIDGSNLYVTRTDLHELLAQSFDAAGERDSAAVHFRAVLRAWRSADPPFQPRRDRAAQWLARHGAAPPPTPQPAPRRDQVVRGSRTLTTGAPTPP